MEKGYESLKGVLDEAFEQSASGKGKERHAKADEPFECQVICEVGRRVGVGYELGQAVKKTYESQRLGGERGVAELLGAIVYLAAGVIVMREKEKPGKIEFIPEKIPLEKSIADNEGTKLRVEIVDAAISSRHEYAATGTGETMSLRRLFGAVEAYLSWLKRTDWIEEKEVVIETGPDACQPETCLGQCQGMTERPECAGDAAVKEEIRLKDDVIKTAMAWYTGPPNDLDLEKVFFGAMHDYLDFQKKT